MIFMRALACIELEMMLFMRNLFLKSLILWSAFDLWAIIASQCWMFSRKQGCLTWYTSHIGCYVLPTFETESFSVLLSPQKFPEILKYWDIENDRIWLSQCFPWTSFPSKPPIHGDFLHEWGQKRGNWCNHIHHAGWFKWL